MYNGAQQTNQVLASQRTAGLQEMHQAQRVISGIPFNHHVVNNVQSVPGSGAVQQAQMRDNRAFLASAQSRPAPQTSSHVGGRGPMLQMPSNQPPPQAALSANPHSRQPSSSGQYTAVRQLGPQHVPPRQGQQSTGFAPSNAQTSPSHHVRMPSNSHQGQASSPHLPQQMQGHVRPTQNAHAHHPAVPPPPGHHVHAQPHYPAQVQPVHQGPPPQPNATFTVGADVHRHIAEAHVQQIQQLRQSLASQSSPQHQQQHQQQQQQQRQRQQPPDPPMGSLGYQSQSQQQIPQPQPQPQSLPQAQGRSQPTLPGPASTSASTSALVPVSLPQPAPAPRSGQSQLQLQIQAPQQANAAPNPPDASHPPSTAVLTPEMVEKAESHARELLEPTRTALNELMGRTHQRLAEQLAYAHAALAQYAQRAARAREEHQALEDALAAERAAREAAEARCGKAEEQVKRLGECIPRLLCDSVETRAERDRLGEEVRALREANALLREKVGLGVGHGVVTRVLPESLEDRKVAVKQEKIVFEDGPKPCVKDEFDAQRSSSSEVADHDAAVAQALAQAHEERKQRQRAERELTAMKALIGIKTSSSESASSSTATPADTSRAPEVVVESRPIEPIQTAAKVEQSDDTPIRWTSFNPFESQLIDLTELDLSLTHPTDRDSESLVEQAQLPPRAEEGAEPNRKHGLETGEPESGRPVAKRQKTLDGVFGQSEGSVQQGQTGLSSESAAPSLPSGTHVSPGSVQTATEDDAMADDSQSKASQPSASIPPPQPTSSAPQARPRPPSNEPPTPSTPSSETPRSDALSVLSTLGLSLPSASASADTRPDGQHDQQQQQQLPTPTSPTPPEHERRKRLSMRHIKLMYDTRGDQMDCRVCRARSKFFKDSAPHVLPASLADWPAIAGHYEREHPAAVERLVGMSADEIREYLHRLQAPLPNSIGSGSSGGRKPSP